MRRLSAFPSKSWLQGGAWVIDVARLPRRAAQAVIDEVIRTVWKAKADGTLPHDLPTVLLIDELNAFSTTGPTATRLASIVRDQRHRRFGLIGLAQQLSTLHPQLLANADTTWFGLTRSSELNEEVYAYLPLHVRAQLTRLPQGARSLESPIYPEPLLGLIPFQAGLSVMKDCRCVRCWEERRQLPRGRPRLRLRSPAYPRQGGAMSTDDDHIRQYSGARAYLDQLVAFAEAAQNELAPDLAIGDQYSRLAGTEIQSYQQFACQRSGTFVSSDPFGAGAYSVEDDARVCAVCYGALTRTRTGIQHRSARLYGVCPKITRSCVPD